jgi:hypothetical protein
MSNLLQDVRYALRSLGKSPGFTAVAVLTLALGIGFNTAVFSVVDAAVFRPLPYAKPAELVRVIDTNPSRNIDRFASSPLNFVDWRAQNRTLSAMAAYTSDDVTLVEGSAPERLRGQSVSPALFPLLGVAPMLGRVFDPEDEKPGRDPVALLSFELWQRRFGGDRSVVGRAIAFEGGKRTVVGVMPRGFRFPTSKSAELWMPLVLDADALGEPRRPLAGRHRAIETRRHARASPGRPGVIAARLGRPTRRKQVGRYRDAASRPSWAARRSRCCCCWAPSGSSCSSPASTCRTFSWRAASAAAGKSPCAPPWERGGRGSSGSS